MSKRTIVIALAALVAAAGALLWASGAALFEGRPAEDAQGVARAQETPLQSTATSAGGVRLEIVSSGSVARYRVREQLAGFSFPNDAVGSTSSIEGMVLFDEEGRVVADASSIRVNVSTLRSDQSRRDNFLRMSSLQSQRYPYVTFRPVEVKGLPYPLPAEGSAEIAIAGDMTIRDVTRRVEWTGTAHFRPDGMRVEASVVVTFAQFQIDKPRVAAVLSVADDIHLEAEIDFRRSG